jgi:hypothetical protein
MPNLPNRASPFADWFDAWLTGKVFTRNVGWCYVAPYP